MKYKYDSESDILSLILADKPFDYAQEMGDFVVHFDKKNKPVYVEILNANRFIAQATDILPKASKKEILHRIQPL